MIFNFYPDDQVINALVWTIIHSIWQFTAIALIMAVLLRVFQKQASDKKYLIALGSLILSFFTGIVTFCYFYFDTPGQDLALLIGHQINSTPVFVDDKSYLSSAIDWIDKYQTPVFYTWVTGVIMFGFRFVLSAVYVEFLSKSSTPVYCQDTFRAFRRVSNHYGVAQSISIGESKYVKSPMILGFIKPIILFPIGIINQLSTEEAEAILAHEIAHFVRKDIYINIIQNLMEALLYYHPAIWWISANIRLERESCCDDLAIRYMGDNIHYARTLLKIQEMAHNTKSPVLALNFSKRESFFSNRIKRILNMAQTRNYLKEKIITSLVLIGVLMFITKEMAGTGHSKIDKISEADKLKQEVNIVVNDSIPNKRESVRIQKKTNDSDISIAIEDGNITELEIDGKKIDKKDYDKYKDIIAEVKPRPSRNGQNRMFYFGDEEGPGAFNFRFDKDMLIDSFMNGFDANRFQHFRDFNDFGMNREEVDKKMEKLNEELGKMDKLHGNLRMDKAQKEKLLEEMGKMKELNRKDFGMSKEQMESLQKEMSKLRFNFDGIDSMKFNIEDFNFPDMKEWGDGQNFRFFGFGDDDNSFGNGYNRDDDFSSKIRNRNGAENFSDAIGNALNRDGLLITEKENKVELTGKYLKINGEKQPTNIFEKYKRIFEESSGTTLEKNSKLQFSFMGKEPKRKYRIY